ncbi:hypothetical protein AHAS_Ahas12G0130200 [Arachis hypogaea]
MQPYSLFWLICVIQIVYFLSLTLKLAYMWRYLSSHLPRAHWKKVTAEDILAEKQPDVSGGTEVAILINDENGKDEKTPENDTLR